MRRLVALGLLFAVGCGGEQQTQPDVVQKETPEDEILRIGRVWQSVSEAKGLRSAPDPVSVFEVRTQSTVAFTKGQPQAEEKIVVAERFEMRSGKKYVCQSEGSMRNRAEFGRFHGEAAVELRRPGLMLERRCDPPDFRELDLEIPAGGARFVLRSDQLVAFAPPLEKRVYLPIE